MSAQQPTKNVFLDFEVYKWLASMHILSQQKVVSNGKLELDAKLSRQFMNGVKFGELAQKLVNDRVNQGENGQQLPPLDSLKDQYTPGVRLYNWNLVSDILQRIGFPFDQDIKSLLVQGDVEMVNEVLKDILNAENSRQEKISRQSVRTKKVADESMDQDLKRPNIRQIRKQNSVMNDSQSTNQIAEEESSVNLAEVDPRKPLSETATLLEFFLTGLSRHLTLRPQQAAALLSNGNKYLAHVMVKGAKNEFLPVSNWLSEVYANLNKVYSFFSNNEVSIQIFLSTLKPGLLSKDMEVSLWTLRTYSKVLFELANMEMHPIAYEWFTKEQGGLAACLMCIKRHPNLVQQVCDVLIQASRYNTNDFFSVQFRKILDQGRDYLEIINMLLEPLVQTKSMKEELLNTGLIQFWSQLALKYGDVSPPEVRATAIRYLSLHWMLYPLNFEEDQNLPNQFLFLVKRATRERSTVLRYISLQCMFRLLDHFANDRNPFAAILYKKLTFSLIENFDEMETREFMEANFNDLFKKFQTIPIEVLIEPLVKQCHLNESKLQLNICDMQVFKQCCTHPRMNLRLAITVLDLMAKVYLNDQVLGQVAFVPIQVLFSRFMENEPVQEYSFKMAKVFLANYYASCQSRRDYPKISDPRLLTQVQQQNNEQAILAAQKRSQIVELLKFTIGLRCASLNEQLKPLVVHFYVEIKQTLKREDKGMLALLVLLGNPEDIVTEVQEQWDLDKQSKEKELEQSQLKEQFENEFSDIGLVQSSDYSKIIKQSNNNNDDPFSQLRDAEAQQEKIFLQQNNLGLKEKAKQNQKQQQQQQQQQQQPQSKPQQSKVDPKVMEQLAQIKLKKEADELNKKMELEEKQRREQQLKKQSQQEIAKRNVQLGVATQNQKNKQIESNALEKQANDDDDFEPTSKQSEQVVVPIVMLEEEEVREQESVVVALRVHQKALKYLWQRYANTTNQAQKKQSFGEMQEQFEVIQFSDVWRLCKDYTVSDYLSREELQSFVKGINQKLLQKRNELTQLDYDGFQKLMVQIALYIFSQPARDYRRYPAGHSLDELIRAFAQVARRKSENFLIFEDPENLNIDPEKETIRELNYQLRENPDLQIPSKFKKITEREQQLKYEYREDNITNLNMSWLHCHEVVNSIIDETFRVQIVEPISEITFTSKVRRKLIESKEERQKLQNAKEENEKEKIPQSQKSQKKSQAKSQFSYMEDSEDDELGVQKRRRELSQKKKNGQIVNKALEEKQQKEAEAELKRLEQEQKFRRHQEKVKEQYKKQKEEKERDIFQKKEDERQKQIDQANKERQQQEKFKKGNEEKKSKLREYKDKLEEEKKKKELDEVEEKKQKEEIKRKEAQEFMKKQQKEVQKVLDDRKKDFKDKEEQEKKKEQKQKEDLVEWKQTVQVMLKEEQESRQKEKEAQIKIHNMLQDPGFEEVFKKYEKQLQAVYSAYQEYSDWRIDNAENEKDLLQFKGFTNFASQFNIYPAVINPEQAQLVFHSISRERERHFQQQAEKNGFNQHPPNGMSFQEFEQSLLRLSIKGQKYFDLIHDRYQQDMKTLEMMNLVKDSKKQEEDQVKKEDQKQTKQQRKNEEDLYVLVDHTTPKTLEGLIMFLDLPQDRSELQSKLRALKLEYQKIVAPRDKRKAFEQKVGEEVPKPRPKNLSQNRNQSAQKQTTKQKDKLVAIDQKELNKQKDPNYKNVGVVGPDGKKEKWQVQS